MSILRDFDEKNTIKCQFCGSEIEIKNNEYNANCPKCGGTINLNDVRAAEWEKLKDFYEKNKQ